MLEILYPGHRNTLCKWDFVFTGDAIADAASLVAVKGGMVVSMSGSLTVDVCNGVADIPVGFLINAPAGNAFENTPGIASERAPFMQSMGMYKVDAEALWAPTSGSSPDWSVWDGTEGSYCYAAGLTGHAAQTWRSLSWVAADNVGFIAPSDGGALDIPVGIIMKAPTVTDPTLIFKSLL